MLKIIKVKKVINNYMCATMKQKLVASKILENNGNISKSMREAGYSKETAKTPKSLTNSKAWPELMEKFLPDSLLSEKHNALLQKEEVVVRSYEGINTIVKTGEIDTQAVKSGLDMAYKLKKKYGEDEIEERIGEKNIELRKKEIEIEERKLELEIAKIETGKNTNRKKGNNSKAGNGDEELQV